MGGAALSCVCSEPLCSFHCDVLKPPALREPKTLRAGGGGRPSPQPDGAIARRHSAALPRRCSTRSGVDFASSFTPSSPAPASLRNPRAAVLSLPDLWRLPSFTLGVLERNSICDGRDAQVRGRRWGRGRSPPLLIPNGLLSGGHPDISPGAGRHGSPSGLHGQQQLESALRAVLRVERSGQCGSPARLASLTPSQPFRQLPV